MRNAPYILKHLNTQSQLVVLYGAVWEIEEICQGSALEIKISLTLLLLHNSSFMLSFKM